MKKFPLGSKQNETTTTTWTYVTDSLLSIHDKL